MTDFAIFSGVDTCRVTPSHVAGLAPAQQTELVLLLRERGVSWSHMENVTGLTQSELMALAEQKHRVSLGGEEQIATDEAKAAVAAARGTDTPINAARALLWLTNAGQAVVAISYDNLEDSAGLGRDSAEYAVEWLLRQKLIGLAGARKRGVASSYRVTRKGEQLAQRLRDGAAA